MFTRNLLIVLTVVMSCSGCAGVRFVVDAVPAKDELTETVVMDDERGRDKVALIEVSGLIADANAPGLLVEGENPVSAFSESLRKASEDEKVRAIIVRINSPGGTVTASDVMYRELLYFKQQSNKPVVILMADLAASGGYYLACAGDEIIAHPTTITGSIGVIMQTVNVSDGLRRIGVRADAITSGPNKAMGSPLEPMPDEHRELLQNIVNEFYANFLAVVRDARANISDSDLQSVTDGRVVTGQTAARVGLVDGLGDLQSAFVRAKQLANFDSGKLVKYHRYFEYVGSPYASTPLTQNRAQEINLVQFNVAPGAGPSTGFYYLWDPTVW